MFRRRSWLLSIFICCVALSPAFAQKNGWEAGGAATFDLNSNPSRPDGWTSQF